MPTRYLMILAASLTLPSPAAADGAQLAALPLAVRVYDATQLSPATRNAAVAVAGAALAAADIDVDWRHCPSTPLGASPEAGCDQPLRSGELVVRLVGGGTPTGTARLMTLGDAMIDRSTGTGRLATIYLDRVVRLAQAAGMDAARLLGYAIAHELGHLLLATTGHGRQGLMRAVWSDDQLRHSRAADWSFTRRELSAIRARQVIGTRMPERIRHTEASRHRE